MLIGTHDGGFHADDVFAIAALLRVYPYAKVIRTREIETLAKADLRVDVGRKYSPKEGDFDHHQVEGAGTRSNGIPYAAFGLIWKTFGKQIAGSQACADLIDKELVQPIDAMDCGKDLANPQTIRPFTFSQLIALLNPSWKEKPDYDKQFNKAVEVASIALERAIIHAKGKEEAEKFVRAAVKNDKDKKYIVLDNYYPWEEVVIRKSEAFYVVYPSSSGKDWTIRCVPLKCGGFENRKALPKEWGGKSDQELQKASGVADAVFCHRNYFMARAKTKEGAIKLAQLAIEYKP